MYRMIRIIKNYVKTFNIILHHSVVINWNSGMDFELIRFTIQIQIQA